MDRKDIKAFVYQCRSYVILCAERVAARDEHLGPSFGKDLAQVGGLGFQMHRKGDLHASEWFALGEFFFESPQKGHMLLYPVNLQFSGRPQAGIPYLRHNTFFFSLRYLFFAKFRDFPPQWDQKFGLYADSA